MKIEPDDADYQRVLGEYFICPSWLEIKAKAVRMVAARLAVETNQQIMAINEKARGQHGPGFLKTQDEVKRLFNRHDDLMRIAFPDQPHSGDNVAERERSET
jgi:hypothetical protein